MRRFHKICLAFMLCLLVGSACQAQAYRFELVNGGRVIARKGPETGSPSVIKVPDWIPPDQRADPAAKYYFYFVSHDRECIYMKWSKSFTGPWFEFNLGGVFNGHVRRGVFDLNTDPARSLKSHVASVDVQIDQDARQIVLLYQGKLKFVKEGENHPLKILDGLVATSANGLNFNDPETSGGQLGHGPKMLKVGEDRQDIWIGPGRQRAFLAKGYWYSVSDRGVISSASPARSPWEPDPNNPSAMAWEQDDRPCPIWLKNASQNQEAYISPAASFLASSEFAHHKNNPYQGIGLNRNSESIDNVGICLLGEGLLEVFFSIRKDSQARFPGIYRVLYDISSPSFKDWKLARDDKGQVLFDVVITPSQINMAIRSTQPDADPIYFADPVLLGNPFIFVDDDSQKYLLYSYVSERFGGYEGSGQISIIKLIPNEP